MVCLACGIVAFEGTEGLAVIIGAGPIPRQHRVDIPRADCGVRRIVGQRASVEFDGPRPQGISAGSPREREETVIEIDCVARGGNVYPITGRCARACKGAVVCGDRMSTRAGIRLLERPLVIVDCDAVVQRSRIPDFESVALVVP